jgi:hypothetical protein
MRSESRIPRGGAGAQLVGRAPADGRGRESASDARSQEKVTSSPARPAAEREACGLGCDCPHCVVLAEVEAKTETMRDQGFRAGYEGWLDQVEPTRPLPVPESGEIRAPRDLAVSEAAYRAEAPAVDPRQLSLWAAPVCRCGGSLVSVADLGAGEHVDSVCEAMP